MDMVINRNAGGVCDQVQEKPSAERTDTRLPPAFDPANCTVVGGAPARDPANTALFLGDPLQYAHNNTKTRAPRFYAPHYVSAGSSPSLPDNGGVKAAEAGGVQEETSEQRVASMPSSLTVGKDSSTPPPVYYFTDDKGVTHFFPSSENGAGPPRIIQETQLNGTVYYSYVAEIPSAAAKQTSPATTEGGDRSGGSSSFYFVRADRAQFPIEKFVPGRSTQDDRQPPQSAEQLILQQQPHQLILQHQQKLMQQQQEQLMIPPLAPELLSHKLQCQPTAATASAGRLSCARIEPDSGCFATVMPPQLTHGHTTNIGGLFGDGGLLHRKGNFVPFVPDISGAGALPPVMPSPTSTGAQIQYVPCYLYYPVPVPYPAAAPTLLQSAGLVPGASSAAFFQSVGLAHGASTSLLQSVGLAHGASSSLLQSAGLGQTPNTSTSLLQSASLAPGASTSLLQSAGLAPGASATAPLPLTSSELSCSSLAIQEDMESMEACNAGSVHENNDAASRLLLPSPGDTSEEIRDSKMTISQVSVASTSSCDSCLSPETEMKIKRKRRKRRGTNGKKEDQDEDSGYLNGTESSDPESGDLPLDGEEHLPEMNSPLDHHGPCAGTERQQPVQQENLSEEVELEDEQTAEALSEIATSTVAVGKVSLDEKTEQLEVIEPKTEHAANKGKPSPVLNRPKESQQSDDSSSDVIMSFKERAVIKGAAAEARPSDAMINSMRHPAHQIQFGDVAFSDIIREEKEKELTAPLTWSQAVKADRYRDKENNRVGPNKDRDRVQDTVTVQTTECRSEDMVAQELGSDEGWTEVGGGGRRPRKELAATADASVVVVVQPASPKNVSSTKQKTKKDKKKATADSKELLLGPTEKGAYCIEQKKQKPKEEMDACQDKKSTVVNNKKRREKKSKKQSATAAGQEVSEELNRHRRSASPQLSEEAIGDSGRQGNLPPLSEVRELFFQEKEVEIIELGREVEDAPHKKSADKDDIQERGIQQEQQKHHKKRAERQTKKAEEKQKKKTEERQRSKMEAVADPLVLSSHGSGLLYYPLRPSYVTCMNLGLNVINNELMPVPSATTYEEQFVRSRIGLTDQHSTRRGNDKQVILIRDHNLTGRVDTKRREFRAQAKSVEVPGPRINFTTTGHSGGGLSVCKRIVPPACLVHRLSPI